MFSDKLTKIRHILREKELDGLVITAQHNLSWLFGGRFFVSLASTEGCGGLYITRDKAVFITDNIEVKRLVDEELHGANLDVISFNWFEEHRKTELAHDITKGKWAFESELEPELYNLRTVLSPKEIADFKTLGKDCAEAMESAITKTRQHMTEFEITGLLSSECWKRGIEPITIFVAADGRAVNYRHPLPTRNTATNYAMIVLCGRRHGLVANLTRFVGFGKLTDEQIHKKDSCIYIDAVMSANTIPGKRMSDIFDITAEAYANRGFSMEWQHHHQGGVTGYNSRESRIYPNCPGKVLDNQAFAWNPSIAGFKSEDTLIIENGQQLIITKTPNLPSVSLKIGDINIEKSDIIII